MTRFVDAYNPATGIKQSVPEHFLDDPVLGRTLRKTPSQRALDGELGPAPTVDSTVPEIRAFAQAADVDVTGLSRKDELLAAVLAVVGTEPLPEPTPTGVVVDVMPEGDVETPAGVDPTSTDGTLPADETPAAGDKE